MKSTKHKIFIAFLCIAAAAAIFVCTFIVCTDKFHSSLTGTWNRTELSSLGITTVKYSLEISEEEIVYLKSDIFSDKLLASYSYETLSPGKIRIGKKEYKVTFNSDKTMLTLTPALSSDEESENWYNV